MQFIDLQKQYQLYKEEIQEEMAAVLNSCSYILGPAVEELENELAIFFAHPRAREIRYPMRYGQSADAREQKCDLRLNYRGNRIRLTLNFNAFESLLLHVDPKGSVSVEDLGYMPPQPLEDD